MSILFQLNALLITLSDAMNLSYQALNIRITHPLKSITRTVLQRSISSSVGV
jgi:hypothetical protein